MNVILKSILDKTRETFEHTTLAVIEKIDTFLQSPTFSIEELAAFIAAHPNTVFEHKTLLGLQYHFYTLNIGDVSFHLETKGETGAHILQLLIVNPNETLFSYHSYEDKINTHRRLRLSDSINNLVNE